MVQTASPSKKVEPSAISTAVSGLLTPLGALVLLSFEGQIIFGPFVLAIEWILARVAARPVRLVWCVLAGALAGQIVYFVLDLRVPEIDGTLALIVGFVTAGLVTGLYLSTSRPAA